MAVGKVVVSVASILLVVGVAIGVVTFINKGGSNGDSNGPINSHQKAVQTICQSTTDQGSCAKTLEPVKSDDPSKLIKAFMMATKEAITKSSNFTDSTEGGLGANISPTNKAVLDYCKRVLMYALEDLETIVEEMGEDLQQSGSKIDQLKQWLTGVFNYQTDCLDDIEEADLKKIMGEGIANSKVLTSNAIDIFHSVVTAMSQMGVKLDDMKNVTVGAGTGAGAGPARRLLEDTDEKGLPNWFADKDRKLMANAGRGAPAGGAAGDDGIGEGGGGGGKIKATHVVAQDGSGQFKTISEAVNACPDKNPGRCIIHIKAGTYNEMVRIPKKKNNIFMFGDGATKTIITNNKSVKLNPGMTTSLSATVQVESEGFMAKWIGFKNTAGPLGHQAVALRVNGDRAVIFNCRFDAYQDTLYVNNGRQFYRNIVVSGTVDFIFGKSATVIQNSLILVRKGTPGQSNYVTADGNEKGAAVKIGIVLHNCRIMPDKELEAEKLTIKSYLGRPWKKFATTVIIGTEMGDLIQPVGWTEWKGEQNHLTAKYIEFNNRGPGANPSQRLPWIKIAKNAAEVEQYTVANWVGPANWIQEANVPVQLGL
ncbi:PREDICTED: probable pectinesterase/pectinesterase inhibitor VGDH2 [Camelina sativa]|uniref:Pectinesterase n=1 Tax=Camelina sativa TaxID=90675 RepID=A0ABM0ZA50_CAMSA|nr:PREDICTED: probable pectinesterase/pectinesterase inhibitor VGDH2 [Camelina sativa]